MMLKNETATPFTLDKYATRARRTGRLHAADNIYASKAANIIAILIFCGIDLFCLSTVWNLVQVDNPVYAWSIALGCALALDIPLAIGAIALKKYHNGMMNRKEALITLISSITVFAIAFVFSLFFRLVTRELSFDIGTSSTLVSTVGETASAVDDSASIFWAALFNGVLPLLTSISSFVISYFSTDPVNFKLKTLETERIKLQANIIDVNTALAQAEDAKTHCAGLICREEDLLSEFIEKINAQNQTLKQLARIIFMKKLGNPEDITAVTASARQIYIDAQHQQPVTTNLATFMDKYDNIDNSVVPITEHAA